VKPAGLAGARLGAAHDVLAGEDRRNRLGLNRCGGYVTLFGDLRAGISSRRPSSANAGVTSVIACSKHGLPFRGSGPGCVTVGDFGFERRGRPVGQRRKSITRALRAKAETRPE
jgi:hypothetical protein